MKFLIDESRIVGLIEDNLTSEVAVKLGLAIGTYFGKKSVIATARDFRSDSHMIKRAISSGLMATGIEILDLHAAPSTVCSFIVRRFGCDGGISYTGAHYLDGEISVRLLNSTGNELEKEELEKIANIAENSSFNRVKRKEDIGGIESIANGMQVYKNALMSFINNKSITKGKFNVVLDLSLGPISGSIPTLFTDLDIDLTTMNGHRTSAINKEGALFPCPDSIQIVSQAVKAINATLGIIIDVEGTKVIFIDNNGKILSADDTSALLIFSALKKRSGTIILSELFTHRFDEAFLSIEGTKIIRVPDSPGNIGRKMDSERAVIGATDNGKLYNPLWGAESDAALSALSMLQLLTHSDKKISEMVLEFILNHENTSSIFKKETIIELDDLDQLFFFRKLRHLQKYKIRDSLIGIKIQFKKGTAHFYTALQQRKINLLIESTSSDNADILLEKCIELSKNVLMKN